MNLVRVMWQVPRGESNGTWHRLYRVAILPAHIAEDEERAGRCEILHDAETAKP